MLCSILRPSLDLVVRHLHRSLCVKHPQRIQIDASIYKLTRSVKELNRGTMILVLSHCLKCSKVLVFFFFKHLLVRRRDSLEMLPAMSKMLLAVGKTATFVCFPSLSLESTLSSFWQLYNKRVDAVFEFDQYCIKVKNIYKGVGVFF